MNRIWEKSIENTNKLSIKAYEFACRMFTYISNLKINEKYFLERIGNKYSLHQLNICYYLF
jgi:hypothetical protein